MFWETSEEDYDKVMAVNLRGPFSLTQESFLCAGCATQRSQAA